MSPGADSQQFLAVVQEIRGTVPETFCIAIGPASDAKRVLKTLHAGADEYVDRAQLESELSSTLVRFKVRQRPLETVTQQPGAVISVLSPSGGCGASTVAANVSVVLARKYGACGLIDLSLAKGDLASLLDLKPEHTLVDLCDRLDRLDQSMFGQFLAKHESGVHLLAAPRDYRSVERVSIRGVRRALALSRVRFPYVLVDLENVLAEDQIEALWQSDKILLVIRLDYTSVRNARRVMDMLAETGIGLDHVDVVVNGCGQSRQLSRRQVTQALEKPISHLIPFDAGQMNRAVNKGNPAVLLRPRARVSRSLSELAASVNGSTKRDRVVAPRNKVS